MAKRARHMSGLQCCMERLQYLAGKSLTVKGMMLPTYKQEICKALGLYTTYNEDGKLEVFVSKCGTITLGELYVSQYKECAKKFDRFYELVNKMPSQKLKMVAELRFVEGYSWKDIAEEIDESLLTVYGYKEYFIRLFKDEGCEDLL